MKKREQGANQQKLKSPDVVGVSVPELQQQLEAERKEKEQAKQQVARLEADLTAAKLAKETAEKAVQQRLAELEGYKKALAAQAKAASAAKQFSFRPNASSDTALAAPSASGASMGFVPVITDDVIKQLQSKEDKIREVTAQARLKIDEYKKELTKQQEENKRLSKTCQDLEEEKQSLKKSLAEENRRLADANRKAEELVRQLNKAEEDRDKLDKEVKEIQSKKQELGGELSETRQKLADAIQKVEVLTSQLDSERQQISKLTQKAREDYSKIEALENRLGIAQSQLQLIQSKTEEMREDLNSAVRRNKDLLELTKKLQQQAEQDSEEKKTLLSLNEETAEKFAAKMKEAEDYCKQLYASYQRATSSISTVMFSPVREQNRSSLDDSSMKQQPIPLVLPEDEDEAVTYGDRANPSNKPK